MSIIYTVVAKSEDIVLCEYTTQVGNFQQITRGLLKKLQREATNCYQYNQFFPIFFFFPLILFNSDIASIT